MNELKGRVFGGERALFQLSGARLVGCRFGEGESPLKHSRGIEAEDTLFGWKYPLWYSRDIRLEGCTFAEEARAGIWYTENISLKNCAYDAPKGFRRCIGVTVSDTSFPNAAETLWHCKNVKLSRVTACGDYLAMNSEDMEIEGLELNGNYSFDGAKRVHIRNSRLISKDAFWNSEDITAENCFISGEYLGWNSKRLTLINCTVESLQGLCFIEDLVMRNCTLVNTTLAFEYSTVDAEIVSGVDSIKNPSGGVIRVAGKVGELITEPDKVDVSATRIEITEE